jgi:hypothetical protein
MLQDDRQNRRWRRSDSRFQCYILSLGNLLKTQAMEMVNSTSLMHAVLEEEGCKSKSWKVEAMTVWRRCIEQQVST